MSPKTIQVGRIYHDGKAGLREVLVIHDESQQVRYRTLAAKVEREFLAGGEEVNILGTDSTVTLRTFATWAKAGYDAAEGRAVLLRLQAAKIKLSPGEEAFLAGVRQETGATVGKETRVSFERVNEGRAVTGLEKKGLLTRHDGEVQFTELGLARLHTLHDAIGA